jgi:hypothetical protein
MSEQHFDGILQDDKHSPDGFKQIVGVGAVLVDTNTGRLVITGAPNDLHNCDRRGCGSIAHKIGEFEIDRGLFEPMRNHREDDGEEENDEELVTDGGQDIGDTVKTLTVMECNENAPKYDMGEPGDRFIAHGVKEDWNRIDKETGRFETVATHVATVTLPERISTDEVAEYLNGEGWELVREYIRERGEEEEVDDDG